MRRVTCINESCYSEALTYGRCYEALAIDDAGQHPKVKLQSDNQRVRWFPQYCFDMRGSPVPLLDTVTLHDDPSDAEQRRVEVDLHFSDGQRRWCWIATPHGLA
jgi:hypothetical protein